MTTVNGTKQSIKRLELPISKFNDVAIPHHLDLLKKHKNNINKFRSLKDWDQVYKEQVNASRIVKQLKQLLHDMDILRSQVSDNDIAVFDKLTTQSRTSTIQAIREYLELEFELPLEKPSTSQQDDFEQNSFDDATTNDYDVSFCQDQEDLERQQACLHAWNNLHQDLEQLHQLYVDFNQVVTDQREHVERIETNVEEAQVNIHEGERFLQKALKYKTVTYPVAGAVLGACIGGPVGLIAGIKLGGLSAACGGILGFTSGQILKKKQLQDLQNVKESDEQKPPDSKFNKNS